jgi:hypothetical protein
MMIKHAWALTLILGLAACSQETKENTREAAGSAARDIERNTEEAGRRIGRGLENLGRDLQDESDRDTEPQGAEPPEDQR